MPSESANFITKIQNVVSPIVSVVNNLLTQLLPGKEEYVVIGIAAYLGWQWRSREYASGGYEVWAKASIIAYLILKILGFGIKIL